MEKRDLETVERTHRLNAALFGIGCPAVFVVISLSEAPPLLILGIRVRIVAGILALGTLPACIRSGFDPAHAEFVWRGIYLFLGYTGSGALAFDPKTDAADRKKNH